MPRDRGTPGSRQGNHPNVPILQTDDAEVIDLVRCVCAVASRTAGPGLCVITVLGFNPVQSLHVDAHKLVIPLHDVIDAMQIVLGSSNKDSLLEKMSLKQVLTFCAPMKGWCADTGQITESVAPM